MKGLIIFISLFFSLFAVVAQNTERVNIAGTLQMPEGDDPQGITIFNQNSNRGTVSNNQGEFNIEVAVNDSVRFSSVQFQGFTVVIDRGIIDAGQMNILVNEVVNFLPEVVVNPYDLTGNVRVDIVRLQVVELPDTLTAGDVRNTYVSADTYEYQQTQLRNVAFEDSDNIPRLVNGLNFVNLFKELLVSAKRDQATREGASLDANVRLLVTDEFFEEYMGIKEENITKFLFYADDMGLDEEMLKEGNELQLIDFLIEQSKKFKKQI